MMNKKALMIGAVAGTMILGAACTANAAFDFNYSHTSSSTSSEITTVSLFGSDVDPGGFFTLDKKNESA